MPRTISASEAKNKFGEVIGWVDEHGDEIIVESRGEPKVVILPYREYEEIKKLREQAHRREALHRLSEIEAGAATRNQDVTEDQSTALADRFSHEFVEDLIDDGTIKVMQR